MRTKLTKAKAQQLLQAREMARISQYELAKKLGWVRSKIKRLEKGEVQSIEEEDLKRLEEVLGLSNSDNVIVLEPLKSRGVFKEGLPFDVVKKEERHVGGDNQVFFRVRMTTKMKPADLLRRTVEIHGYEGAIHGVESLKSQGSLKIGDEVLIMLWGRGIASRQGPRSSTGA